MSNHKFYAELITGERKPITEAVHQTLTVVHGWVQVLALPNLTIIKGGRREN